MCLTSIEMTHSQSKLVMSKPVHPNPSIAEATATLFYATGAGKNSKFHKEDEEENRKKTATLFYATGHWKNSKFHKRRIE